MTLLNILLLSISEAMFVSFLALLLLPRLLVGVMSVRVVLGLEDLKPTISAKVAYLGHFLTYTDSTCLYAGIPSEWCAMFSC